MDALQLLIAASATWQAVEIWHHGKIFANWRAEIELWEGFFGKLLRCPFCLSVWIGSLMTVLVLVSGSGRDCWPCFFLRGFFWLFVHGLAVSRLANLGNDLYHDRCRTPKGLIEIEPEEKES